MAKKNKKKDKNATKNELVRVYKYNIKKGHELYDYCDRTCFVAKNLRNLATYHIRQCYILCAKEEDELTDENKEYLKEMNRVIDAYNLKRGNNFIKTNQNKIVEKEKELEKLILQNASIEEIEEKKKDLETTKTSEYKPHPHLSKQFNIMDGICLRFYFSDYLDSEDNPYKQINPSIAGDIILAARKEWKNFFTTKKDYRLNKSKYSGMPKMPGYTPKEGRSQYAISYKCSRIRDGYLLLTRTEHKLKVGRDTATNFTFKGVRIVPKGDTYNMEIMYGAKVLHNEQLNKDAYIGIDLGLSNLATITNNIGLKPIIINGRPLKSINQYYNKKKATMQSQLPFINVSKYNKESKKYEIQKCQRSSSKSIETLTRKRNNKIENYMHKASAYIINYCIENKIGNIVIGKNDNWKKGINIGKVNNQNFVSVPFNKLIEMITYKSENHGIKVHIVDEAYTSKASFLDLDEIPNLQDGEIPTFSGQRTNRGLYKTKNTIINADVNGSYNILRKFDENMFTKKDLKRTLTIPTIINLDGYINKKKLVQT
jgi:putative transposase